MKLSNDTLAILKNFASINSNLVFKEDSVIRTISESKTILAKADITESFDKTFGIYDLNEFLSVCSLIDDSDIQIGENSVSIKGKGQNLEYFFSDIDILTQPSKDIVLPSVDVKVLITEDNLNQIRRAASVLRHEELSIVGKDGTVTANVINTKDATANNYSIVLDENNECKDEFNFDISIPNLKLLSGDYNVEICRKLISRFVHAEKPVEYFVALEKTSKYNP